jgi:branched-chain amino acid transport system permease protein
VKNIRIWGLFALVALIIALPLVVGDPTFTSLGVYVLLFTCAAMAWNLFSGFTGYISLGHVIYFGVGAYTLALLCQRYNIPGGLGPFLLLPLCGLVTAFFAIPIGWIALHARRSTFMVISIAFFFIVQMLASNMPGITGGMQGIYLPVAEWGQFVYDLPFYYLALVITLLVTTTAWWLHNSKFGLGLLAIRDDEERARSLGVPISRFKLFAYVLSAFFIGMVGAMLAYYTEIIYPSFAFNTNFDITVAVIVFMGGIGTVSGPIVGGLLLEPLQQYLNLQFSSFADSFGLVLFGIILLVIIILFPEGVVPIFSKYWKMWITMYNSKYSRKTLQPAFGASSTTSQIQADPIDSQVTYENSVVLLQPSAQVDWKIPHRFTEKSEPASFITITNPKIKAQRLVSISHDGSITSQKQVTAHASVSWRCPRCQRPFLLNGNTCYCPRCGFTRPLGVERESSSPKIPLNGNT